MVFQHPFHIDDFFWLVSFFLQNNKIDWLILDDSRESISNVIVIVVVILLLLLLFNKINSSILSWFEKFKYSTTVLSSTLSYLCVYYHFYYFYYYYFLVVYSIVKIAIFKRKQSGNFMIFSGSILDHESSFRNWKEKKRLLLPKTYRCSGII